MNNKGSHTWLKVLAAFISIAAAVTSLIAAIAAVFYRVAFARERPKVSEKVFKDDEKEPEPDDVEHDRLRDETAAWLNTDNHATRITATSFDGLKLSARLVFAPEESKKTAILIHGFHASPEVDFGGLVQFYHSQGYNVLLPDDRAHGESEGKYLGFGWLDRRDAITWSTNMVHLFGEDSEIILHGVSMGAATVMMASGEKDLPKQVKGIIEDCGFSDSMDEFRHTIPSQFKFMTEPVLAFDRLYSRIANGYDLKDASSVEQLKMNYRPMLFIHGGADDFVPTHMVYECYYATKGPKMLYVPEGVGHARSYAHDPETYEKKIKEFMAML